MDAISRREFLARAAGAAGAGALAMSGLIPPAPAQAATSKALWGAFVAPRGATRISSIKAFEDMIERRIDVTRGWSTPSSRTASTADTSR
jgi:spermidine/putrescine-binding protein